MTIDEAKFELHQEIQAIKRVLRDREIIVNTERNRANDSIVTLNGFITPQEFQNVVLYNKFREMHSKIEYVYMCELDDMKRKKLALYIIMQFSFKEHKYIKDYHTIHRALNSEQQAQLTSLEAMQEKMREDIIQSLKAEYLRNDPEAVDVKSLKKIVWKGNRKQLAELFVELEQKEWIVINEGNRKPICETITMLFDIEGKEKDEPINVGSFYTTFRPDPTLPAPEYSYIDQYNKIYTKFYYPKFQLVNKCN